MSSASTPGATNRQCGRPTRKRGWRWRSTIWRDLASRPGNAALGKLVLPFHAGGSSTGEQVARSRARLYRAVHGHPRRHDRERGAGLDPAWAALLADEPPVDRERV